MSVRGDLTALGYGENHLRLIEIHDSTDSRRNCGSCPGLRRRRQYSICPTTNARRSTSRSNTSSSTRPTAGANRACVRRAVWQVVVDNRRARCAWRASARVASGCSTQGTPAVEVHRAQLRAMRLCEKRVRRRESLWCAAVVDQTGKAEVVLNEAEVFACLKCGNRLRPGR